MTPEVILIIIAATGVAFLAGFAVGKERGFDEGYEAAKVSYEELGEFLGKEDREMLLK
ncbi:MAG: hypothetical protein GX964_01255 [Syntrophomonadaceae bacterium]|jgi:hypothetical protein|nr:hypothetical protein [Syntrophomonadaceae bacterium]